MTATTSQVMTFRPQPEQYAWTFGGTAQPSRINGP
jgi:hypothetical protein